jgi:hypothetical protein
LGEQLYLPVETGPPEDLGRYRRTVGNASVEPLFLDCADDRVIEAPGHRTTAEGRSGLGECVGDRSAGEDRRQRQCAGEQGTME